MERILHSMPEADKEWLDDQLLNRFCIVEAEARELYLGWIPGCDTSAVGSRNLKQRKNKGTGRRGNAAAACSLPDK